MSRAVLALLLLAALSAGAKKPPVAARPPPPTATEEEAALPDPEAIPEEPLEDPELDPGDLEAIPEEPVVDPPGPRTSREDPASSSEELTDDEAAALGAGGLCCCLIFLIGLVGLIVWLVKRGSRPAAPVQPSYPGAYPPPQPHRGLQLTIFALALEPGARERVEQQLTAQGISPVPDSPEARGRLVREAARVLLTLASSWRQFGYGEKPGIPELAGAEAAYRSASEDFRARARSVGATATGGGGLVVLTLLICCRRPLFGATQLHNPLQVRSVLEDRLRVSDQELLGAELLWAPAAPGGRVTEAEIGLRFPEMMPLSGQAI